MSRRREGPEVKRAVLNALRRAEKPLKRRELLHEVSVSYDTPYWSRETLARRIREAIAELFTEGVCVVSDGQGFRIAKSSAEREEGLWRKKRMALSLLKEIAIAEKIPLGRVFVQLQLFAQEERAAEQAS